MFVGNMIKFEERKTYEDNHNMGKCIWKILEKIGRM